MGDRMDYRTKALWLKFCEFAATGAATGLGGPKVEEKPAHGARERKEAMQAKVALMQKPWKCNNCLYERNGRAFDLCKKCKMEWWYKGLGPGTDAERGQVPDSWRRGCQASPAKGGTANGCKNGKVKGQMRGSTDPAAQRPRSGYASDDVAGADDDGDSPMRR